MNQHEEHHDAELLHSPAKYNTQTIMQLFSKAVHRFRVCSKICFPNNKCIMGNFWLSNIRIFLGRIMSDSPRGSHIDMITHVHKGPSFTPKSAPQRPSPSLFSSFPLVNTVDFMASRLVCVCWHISSCSKRISVHEMTTGREREGTISSERRQCDSWETCR